jgi:hypothetical protein
MELNFGAALPWLVAFVIILSLYLYVRGKRVTRSKKTGRR